MERQGKDTGMPPPYMIDLYDNRQSGPPIKQQEPSESPPVLQMVGQVVSQPQEQQPPPQQAQQPPPPPPQVQQPPPQVQQPPQAPQETQQQSPPVATVAPILPPPTPTSSNDQTGNKSYSFYDTLVPEILRHGAGVVSAIVFLIMSVIFSLLATCGFVNNRWARNKVINKYWYDVTKKSTPEEMQIL